jgi:hypothetical protein
MIDAEIMVGRDEASAADRSGPCPPADGALQADHHRKEAGKECNGHDHGRLLMGKRKNFLGRKSS